MHSAAFVTLGSTQSSEPFCQVTDKMRLADFHGRIFEIPAVKGRLHQEKTLTKFEAMSEVRTDQKNATAVRPMETPRSIRRSATLTFHGLAGFCCSQKSLMIAVEATVYTPKQYRLRCNCPSVRFDLWPRGNAMMSALSRKVIVILVSVLLLAGCDPVANEPVQAKGSSWDNCRRRC